MKIDITSMFFNSKIEGQTATAAWGTSIARQTEPCTIYETPDVNSIMSGMLFSSKTDYSNLNIDGMSKNRELILFSVFDKIFVNGQELKDASFILLLVREHSQSHDGRLLLSYPMYAKYTKDNHVVSNDDTRKKIASLLGCSETGCWFVSDIAIANQDTLLINAHVVDSENPAVYKESSKQRSAAWKMISEASQSTTNEEMLKILGDTRFWPTADSEEYIKEQFEKYLKYCAKAQKNKNNEFNYTDSAVASYLAYMSPKLMFEYNPEKWAYIDSLYSISSVDEIRKICDELFSDKAFNEHEKKKGQWSSGALMHYCCFLEAKRLFASSNEKRNNQVAEIKSDLQKIYYGAPGTGKSHTVDDVAKVYKHHRITFHPDSDYSSFVGCYKPVMSEEDKDKIIYSFTPQAFTNAYIEAWELNAKKEPVFLVIEEINRGNCAQIFGDLFQLLDRKDDGYSKYEITPDTELQKYIAKQGLSVSGILDSDRKDISDKINSGELMKLPNNLHIWATMNTSDQSLFPIDSAFKRRWDWVYVPIEEGVDKDTNQKLDWQIEADENHKPVSWWQFLQKINMIIADLTSSEDKQLGYFFCKPDKEDKKTISKERFVGKVLFYLWNDIFKDYAFDLDICKKAKDNKKVQYFANFYKKQNVIDIDALINFFEKLDSSQKEIEDKEVIIFTKKSADSAPEPIPTAPEE